VNVAPRVVEIDDLTFTEVLSITRINGGIADNVIPDLVECHINFRFTPDRTPAQAREVVRDLVGGVGELEISSVSPSGSVAPRTALLERLIASGGFAVAPKQAWTPVAQFSEVGIDAVNLGPGATAMAHTRDERIAIDELVRAYAALETFVRADRAT
jgi:succinyl-diaminopimelate desuccinylase